MATAARTIIDQAEDFVEFQIDGHAFEIDLDEAGEKLAEIDRRHKDDLIECVDCGAKFTVEPGSGKVHCPSCKSGQVLIDQSFLDDVAAYVQSKGVKRCGRRASALFYNALCDALVALKKNTVATPESPTGTADSTPPDGLPVASEHF
jgi:Zn finger protein HypA/HybF involved in hydrogenase expression